MAEHNRNAYVDLNPGHDNYVLKVLFCILYFICQHNADGTLWKYHVYSLVRVNLWQLSNFFMPRSTYDFRIYRGFGYIEIL